jgi:hypothetical protein
MSERLRIDFREVQADTTLWEPSHSQGLYYCFDGVDIDVHENSTLAGMLVAADAFPSSDGAVEVADFTLAAYLGTHCSAQGMWRALAVTMQ